MLGVVGIEKGAAGLRECRSIVSDRYKIRRVGKHVQGSGGDA